MYTCRDGLHRCHGQTQEVATTQRWPSYGCVCERLKLSLATEKWQDHWGITTRPAKVHAVRMWLHKRLYFFSLLYSRSQTTAGNLKSCIFLSDLCAASTYMILVHTRSGKAVKLIERQYNTWRQCMKLGCMLNLINWMK